MERRNRPIFLASTVFILAIIAFGFCSVQGVQAAQSLTQQPTQLIPPPPSAPYWTYKTGSDVRAVAVSADGNTIVAGSYDQKIYVFGRDSNTTLWTYGPAGGIYSVGISADGSTIVAAGSAGNVLVFGRDSNTTIWKYKGTPAIYSVAISDDGNTIVSGGGNDHTIRVFSRESNTTIWWYYTGQFVRSVAVSADGTTIVAGGTDDCVRVFGRQDNVSLWTYDTGNIVNSVAVSADGNTIVAGGRATDGLHVFSRQSNATLWKYYTGAWILGVAVSRDGTTIAVGTVHQYFWVFGRNSNVTLIEHNLFWYAHIYKSIALSSDGSTIAFGTAQGYKVSDKAFLFSKSSGFLWSYDVGDSINNAESTGPAVGISSDGSLVAYGCDDDKLYVFQYDTVPPVLGTPSILPSSPVGGQSANVSISVTDNLELSTVTLHYRNTSSGSWSYAAMSLAGSAYKATIGPFSSGDVVSYYITAADTSGNTAGSPADAPLSYYVITVGTPAPRAAPSGIEWTSVLIGAGLAFVVALAVSLVVGRGKKSRG